VERFRHPPGRVRSVRRAAVAYAERGWAVVPGAYGSGGRRRTTRCECGRLGCRKAGLHPLFDQWDRTASTDVSEVAGWWARHAWEILLPTGHGTDVLEVPGPVGRATADLLGERAGPIAVLPGHRWLLLCATGERTVTTSEQESRAGVLLHSQGSWVSVPPNGGMRGRGGWFRPPWVVNWRLPGTTEVLAAARAAATSAAESFANPLPAPPAIPAAGRFRT
jgi:bifunctional DNA primase/polymerase-like protein